MRPRVSELPERMKVLSRIPRLSLGCTLATTLALLLAPALLLRQFPRAQAIGLERLMANVSLLQSFRATPDRPVPELWQQRLGSPVAEQLWRFQTLTWWQFWDGQPDAQPYLALSARGLPAAMLRSVTVPPLLVGDLAIFPPDPVSREILRVQLQPQVRRSSGLRLRCLPRLERDQAVFWRPSGLGVLLGPLAPFLQNLQEGCLSLAIQGNGLLWNGEAASVEGMVLQLPPGGQPLLPPQIPPPASDVLLQVQGGSLEQLLSGLLARELIRQPLADRYGFGPQQLSLLRETPFQLVLRPRADEAFQASLELTVPIGNKEAEWKVALGRLAESLRKEGFRAAPTEAPGSAIWQRTDGAVVGGWQWQTTSRQLLLFLGPRPTPPVPYVPSTIETVGMVLRARPTALAERGLLPPDLPEVVKRSNWLWFTSAPVPGFGRTAALSRLQGSLVLLP